MQLEVEAAYGMDLLSARCATLLRENLWPCEMAEVLHPPYLPKQHHLPGLSRQAEGISTPWVEMVCGISDHLRPPLQECYGKVGSNYQQLAVPCGGLIFVVTEEAEWDA
jgi:hypothetical protein